MIVYFFVLLTSIHYVGGQINGGLNITGIRLANGNGPNDGRVELRVYGIWGTICDDSFDMNDAKVLCRMLNSSATWYFRNAKYGEGTGPIFATNLRCYGYESHLNQCRYNLGTTCTHSKDVSIICTRCGYIKTANVIASSIYVNGNVMTAKCMDKFDISENINNTCTASGIWDTSTLICKSRIPITDIRLVNGVGLYDGRVEIKMNGTWGDVCLYSYTSIFASGLCNILFNLPYSNYGSNGYGYNDNVHMTNLSCDGKVTDIQECYFDLTTSCHRSRRTYVICKPYPLNITDIRLVSGTGPYDGRVELKYKDMWGTICNYRMNNNVGNTLCRMLNLSLASFYTTAKFGQGTGPVLFGEVLCNSNDVHINDCYRFYAPYKWLCDHDSDTSIICTDCGLPSIPNGKITSANGRIMTVTCNLGCVPTTYNIECLNNGTWLQNETCQVYGYPLNITDMRLAGGIGLYDGRLEVKVNDTWGSVCSGSFSYNEARAICNMFNSTYISYTTNSNYYASGSGPIYIDQLDCEGSEIHINQCKYNVLNTCSHSSDVFVICNDIYRVNITNMRLEPGPYHGRVEIEVNGTWGTICRKSWDSSDARVICRMMNLTVRAVYGNSYYGEGNGSIHLDRIICSGNEPDINECSYIYTNSCTHEQGSSVICYGPYLNITDVRLANGTGPHNGRAEIKANGTWGTICDHNFDINDANAFCNMLGLRGAEYFTGATHGEGSGPVYIDELFCYYSNSDLNKCSYVDTNVCRHDRDVSVVCTECGKPEIDYWGIGFFIYEGTTLFADCAYYKSYVGTLRMVCDNVTKNWIIEGECQEYICREPTPFKGIRNSTSTTYGSVVEISCEDGNQIIGTSTIICQADGTWSDSPVCGSYAPVTSVTMIPDEYRVNVIENTVIEFTCTALTARPAASVYWYRDPNNSNEITQITENITTTTTDFSDLSVTTSTLHFVPQRQHSNTRIYCTANNSVNTSPVSSNKKILLNVLYKADDSFIIQGNEYRVMEHTSVTLTCTVRGGNPTPTVSWRCNNFSPTNQTKINSNGNITTTLTWNVSRTHEGTCTCTSQQTNFTTETIDVSVIVVYEVSHLSFSINGITDTIVTVNESTAVTFRCITDGNPPPVMTLINGTNVLVSRTSRQLEYNLLHVSCQDIGTYSCSTRNELNVHTVVSSIDLIVHCSPRPIEDMKKEILSGIGMTVDIIIGVIGYPTPSFTWWSDVNDQWNMIQTTDRRFINSSGLLSSLTINNVNEDDFTSYKVVAENSVGNMEQIYKLRDGSPDMPTQLRYFETLSTSSSIQLAWNPGYNGGSTQIFYIKYKSTDESFWKYQTVSDDLEQTRIYTLTNLKDDMFYYIIILASNKYGNSTESSPLIANTKEIETTHLAFMIGGIVGGVIFLAAILMTVFILIRRNQTTTGCLKQPSSCQPPESVPEYESINQNNMESSPYSNIDQTELCTTSDDLSEEKTAVYENLKLEVF